MVVMDNNGYRLKILPSNKYEVISRFNRPTILSSGIFTIGPAEELAFEEGRWRIDENYIIDKLLEKYL